jgi:hypothetical protein
MYVGAHFFDINENELEDASITDEGWLDAHFEVDGDVRRRLCSSENTRGNF